MCVCGLEHSLRWWSPLPQESSSLVQFLLNSDHVLWTASVVEHLQNAIYYFGVSSVRINPMDLFVQFEHAQKRNLKLEPNKYQTKSKLDIVNCAKL